MCDCDTKSSTTMAFTAIDLTQISAAPRPVQAFAAAGGTPVADVLFVSSGFNKVNSSAHIDADGRGVVTIGGNLGFISVEGTVTVELTDGVIKITLEVTKPIQVGPLSWEFAISGNQLHLKASPDAAAMNAAAASSPRWLCVARCAGLALLPTVIACLPSLAAGPPAFITCLIGKIASEEAGKIATCITENCAS